MRLNIAPKHISFILAASLLGLAACGKTETTEAPDNTPAQTVEAPPESAPPPPETPTPQSATIAAHVHGDAELLVTRSDNNYTAELFSPVANFGAEETQTDAEALGGAISESLGGTSADDVLDAFAQNFIWPSAANCAFNNGSEIYGFDGDHANVTLTATFNCEKPNDIDELQVELLDLAGLETIEAVALIGDAQYTGELTSDARTLALK